MQLSNLSAQVFSLLFFTVLSSADPSSIFTSASNSSLLWGPYRPNLYFGIRPRLPNSLTTGLLWSRVEDYQTVANDMRFTCEQHSGMASYGWDMYDPRTGGVQTVRDKGNGIDLETSFVKFGQDGSEGWGARIKGTVREDAEPMVGSQNGVANGLKTAVWFTVGVGGLGNLLQVRDLTDGEDLGFAGDVVINGDTADLGEFSITITEPDGNSHPVHNHASYASKPLDRTFVHSVQIPEEAVWQGKRTLIHLSKFVSAGDADIDNQVFLQPSLSLR